MAGEQRADHHHRGAEAHALGDVAVMADAAIGDDRLGGHTRAPLERRQLPAAGAEAGLQPRDAHLARADADLGRVGAPVLQIDHRLGRADVAGDDEGVGQLLLDVFDHAPHAVGVAVRDVDGDVVGPDAFGRQAVDDWWSLGLTPELMDTNSLAFAHARAQTPRCRGRSGASRRSSRCAARHLGDRLVDAPSSCWRAPPAARSAAARTPPRCRTRCGCRRGICAAAAGCCRSRRFPCFSLRWAALEPRRSGRQRASSGIRALDRMPAAWWVLSRAGRSNPAPGTNSTRPVALEGRSLAGHGVAPERSLDQK